MTHAVLLNGLRKQAGLLLLLDTRRPTSTYTAPYTRGHIAGQRQDRRETHATKSLCFAVSDRHVACLYLCLLDEPTIYPPSPAASSGLVCLPDRAA